MTFWGDGPDHLGLHAIAGKARKIVVILSSKETKVKKDLALLLEQKNEVAKPKPPEKKKAAKRKRATPTAGMVNKLPVYASQITLDQVLHTEIHT